MSEEVLDLESQIEIPQPEDLTAIPEPEPYARPANALTAFERVQLRAALAERFERSREALRIYRPMPLQQAFHECEVSERIIRGGNRAGKTLAAAVEFARAVTGQDPYQKYPKTGGRAIAVGKDLIHCSKVMYRKLFKSGAIRMVPDPETGIWRSFDPEKDSHLVRLSRPAGPLIAQRFYKPSSISWENRREEIPRTIRLETGWEITFFSSIGPPPQGWDVDLVWFDEEIEHPAWYPEMAARLIDRRVYDPSLRKIIGGKFVWSATPQAGTIQLYDLCEQAREQAGQDDATVAEFFTNMDENVYLERAAKEEFKAKMRLNEDEYRVRVEGQFALAGNRVFPEFDSKRIHCIDPFPIPNDWTIYASIDPGRQVCAVLFAAVAPPRHEHSGKVILFDELYIRRSSALTFAEQMRQKTASLVVHKAFIDGHAGRVAEMGSGKTVEFLYSDALRRAGVKFESGGHGFTWGSDDLKAGIEAVRSMLHIGSDGRPRLLVMRGKCPNLQWEMERYSFRRISSTGLTTDDVVKRADHLCDCLRYLAMANLRWVASKSRSRRKATNQYLEDKKKRAAIREGKDGRIVVG